MNFDFLTDWQFWSSLVAFLALGLSQAPPVRLWFKESNLDLEVQSSIYLSHLIGIQFFQVYVSLINTGGRSVRVRDIQLSVTRTGQESMTFPIQGLFQKRDDNQSVFFVPFTSRPGDEWAYICNFSPVPTREQERQFREAKSALQANINDKIRIRDNVGQMAGGINVPIRSGMVEADENLVTPFKEHFEQNFSMVVGEYQMTVTVVTDKVSASKDYDFTVFESDETDLRNIVNDYKFGTWITWDDPNKSKFIRIPIREAK